MVGKGDSVTQLNAQAIIIQTMLADAEMSATFGDKIYSTVLPEGFEPPGIVISVGSDIRHTNMDTLVSKQVDIVVVGTTSENAQSLNRILRNWYEKSLHLPTAYGRVSVVIPLSEEGMLDEEEEVVQEVNWTFIRTGFEIWLVPAS